VNFPELRTFDRGLAMAAMIVSIVPAFWLTNAFIDRYHDRRQTLALEWSRRGEHDLEKQPGDAVADFETALSYRPDRTTDRFRLATALIAAKRPAEARAHLLTLWTEEPGDGQFNLALARLAAGDGKGDEAVRYYHAAVDGTWDSASPPARRVARLELARLLMAAGQPMRAQAELIALIDDLPPDPQTLIEVGNQLVEAGAPTRAVELFQRALVLDPSNGNAARLAGESAFRAGDYVEAHRFLLAASAREPLDGTAREMFDVSDGVVALDTSVAGIGAKGRAERLLHSVAIASARLARCEAASTSPNTQSHVADLKSRLERSSKTNSQVFERDTDLVDRTIALVFEVERLPTAECGADSVGDRALAILAGQDAGQLQ
jgi:tetratricopeptide (TPR) repeat protein